VLKNRENWQRSALVLPFSRPFSSQSCGVDLVGLKVSSFQCSTFFAAATPNKRGKNPHSILFGCAFAIQTGSRKVKSNRQGFSDSNVKCMRWNDIRCSQPIQVDIDCANRCKYCILETFSRKSASYIIQQVNLCAVMFGPRRAGHCCRIRFHVEALGVYARQILSDGIAFMKWFMALVETVKCLPTAGPRLCRYLKTCFWFINAISAPVREHVTFVMDDIFFNLIDSAICVSEEKPLSRWHLRWPF